MRRVWMIAVVSILIVALGVYLWAAPAVASPNLNPPVVTVGVPTPVLVTSEITDPALLPGGVNLLRIPASGSPSVLGIMRDDGLAGDALAGDKKFTLRLTVNETATGAVRFRVSAAFRGLLQRVTADTILTIQPAPSALLSGAPTDLAYSRIPDLAFPDPDLADFVLAPGLGTPISVPTVLLSIKPGATVGQVNSVLISIGGNIVGANSQLGWIRARLITARSPQAMLELFNRLRTDPLFKNVVIDSPIELARLPGPSDFQNWVWSPRPPNPTPFLPPVPVPPPPALRGNWGLEQVRAPQAWNLLQSAVREKGAARTLIGMIDGGYVAVPDLNGILLGEPGGGIVERLHGAAVAGVIAGMYHNYEDLDGIAPMVSILGMRFRTLEETATKLFVIGTARPDIRVINASIQVPPSTARVATGLEGAPADIVDAQNIVLAWGKMVAELLQIFDSRRADGTGQFLIAAAAGNSTVPAYWGSPYCNAAARFATASKIFCVESVGSGPGLPRSWFSNFCTGADFCISAPGERVTLLTNMHDTVLSPVVSDHNDGTSFAAPLVAGAAAFLMHYLDTSIAHTYLLLQKYSVPAHVAGFRAPMLDLHLALDGYDREFGKTKVLKDLLDIDDGSQDGNARADNIDLDNDGNVTETYTAMFTSDGFRGNGNIDMGDFRTLRDHVLQLVQNKFPDLVHLDGGVSHFKKDLNEDGCVNDLPANPPHPVAAGPAGIPPAPEKRCKPLTSEYEVSHGRADFNGDTRVNGLEVVPPASSVSVFRDDPQTNCKGLKDPSPGCLRDLDILALVWDGHLSREHVKATHPFNAVPGEDVAPEVEPCMAVGPPDWRPTTELYADRDNDGVIDYFRSADLHFILGPDTRTMISVRVLWKKPGDATFSLFKCMVLGGPISRTRTMLTVPLLTSTIRVVFTAIGGPLPPIFQPLDLVDLKWGQDVSLIWPGGMTGLSAVP